MSVITLLLAYSGKVTVAMCAVCMPPWLLDYSGAYCGGIIALWFSLLSPLSASMQVYGYTGIVSLNVSMLWFTHLDK